MSKLLNKNMLKEFAVGLLNIFSTKRELSDGLSKKSNTGHTHDDRYYTETEVDDLIGNINTNLNNKVPVTIYKDTKGDIYID